jgi:hypothetical protein
MIHGNLLKKLSECARITQVDGISVSPSSGFPNALAQLPVLHLPASTDNDLIPFPDKAPGAGLANTRVSTGNHSQLAHGIVPLCFCD